MKKGIILLTLLLATSITGCSSANNIMKEQIRKKSGITDDADYQKYEEYSETGKLDESGYYSEVIFDEEATGGGNLPRDIAHVTFSTNEYLNVHYFSDKEKNTPLDTQDCNLKVGNSIYATVSIGNDVASSMYDFSGFRIYQYEDGNRTLLSTVTPNEDGLVLQIEDQYIGKDISIAPIGDYETRVISLKDSYFDNNEEEHNLSGTWVINDQEVTDDTVGINPVSSYIISYKFDGDEYFYLSSTPECYYSNSEDGIVIFNKRESTDETADYSVQLHEYVSVALPSAEHRYVSLNSSRGVIYDGSEQEIKNNTELTIPRLKYGDSVTIATDKLWPDLENCRDLYFQSLNKVKDAYIYTMIVPQKGGEFEFNPADYTYEHGTVIFKCFGEIITSTQYLAKGARITYQEGTAEEGYWLPNDNNNVITVTDTEETIKALKSIHFSKKFKASVVLNQPEYGGTIHYYVDGNEIKSKTYSADSGTIISMKFEPWEGWICNYKNDVTYQVIQSTSQTLTINGHSTNDIFREDDSHKPTLEVILDKSVGEDMNFQFEASGLDKDDYKYEEGWFRETYTVIENAQIGTEKGISISMGNRAIPSGKAVKILVEKTDTDKNKTSYYRLVTDLYELQDPIPIYEKGKLGKSRIWYKSIRIIISVVDVETFTAPKSIQHTSISVHNEGTSSDLKTGDLIENSEHVLVTIYPDHGYYITGKDVKDDVYKKSMLYSDYQKNIQDIIVKHPAEKYFKITFDASDKYGACTYTVGGEAVTGTRLLKEGDVITLDYKITSAGYAIDGASGVLGSDFLKNDQEASATLTVSSDLDGKTINRETFGINVVKVG